MVAPARLNVRSAQRTIVIKRRVGATSITRRDELCQRLGAICSHGSLSVLVRFDLLRGPGVCSAGEEEEGLPFNRDKAESPSFATR